MRLIDADYLIALGNEDGAYGLVSVEEIKDAPTIFTTPVAVKAWMNKADLVEVVRCKDCVYSYMDDPARICKQTGCIVDDEFFCAYGERREDATD